MNAARSSARALPCVRCSRRDADGGFLCPSCEAADPETSNEERAKIDAIIYGPGRFVNEPTPRPRLRGRDERRRRGE